MDSASKRHLDEADVQEMEAKGDIEGLVKALRNKKDAGLRKMAALALGNSGAITAVDPLIDSLKDKDGLVRTEAQEALARIGKPAVETLINALNNKKKQIREGATRALETIGNAEAAHMIVETARDHGTWSAKDILTRAGNELLIITTKTEASDVRQNTVDALDRLGWQPVNETEKACYLLVAGRWEELVQLGVGETAGEVLGAVLKDGCEHFRAEATSALEMIGESPTTEPIARALAVGGTPPEIQETPVVSQVPPLVEKDLEDSEGIVQALLEDLRGGDTYTRKAAADTLERMGWEPENDEQRANYLLAGRWQQLATLGQAAVDTLIRALKEGDENIRAGAVWALGSVGGATAVETLAQTMNTESGALRRSVVVALGETRDSSAVEPLVQALADEDGLVRGAAARALAKIGKDAVESILQAAKDTPFLVHRDATAALAMIGQSSVEPLLGALKSEDRRLQLTAAEALAEQGWHPANESENIDYLIVTRQWDALATLGPSAVGTITQALRHKDAEVRAGAARTLAGIGDKAAVEAILQSLKDEASWVRRDAAEALGKMKDPRAIQPLIHALEDEDEWVRIEVIDSLVEIGRPAVDLLGQAASDQNSRIRNGATEALRQIGEMPAPQPISEVPEAEEAVASQEPQVVAPPAGPEEAAVLIAAKQWDRLVGLGATAVEALIQAFKDEDASVREKAAEAIAKIGQPAVGPLIKALKDENSRVRGGAAWTLGQIKDEQAVEALISALGDEHDTVRQNSVWALGELRVLTAVQPLLTALKDKDNRVRQYSAAALGEMKDEGAVDSLVEALNDPVTDVRGQAAWALGQIKNSRGVEPLVKALSDEDKWVRRDVVEALGEIKDERAVEPLIQTLKEGDKWLQTLAASALGNIGGERAFEALVQALSSSNADVTLAAEDALARMVRSKGS